ncbi:uncharacterized protein [Montipora capricornis]|uniref:uncharacterized protein n=1 Tax=Montipora capricornis TaxID=246305 RepID=UPI0035F1B9B3
MFNKRRGGEASRMLLKSYLNRPDWNQVNNPEIMSTLSEFEKELSKRLDMVEIIGKRGKKVPVILTAEMTRSIDLLIKTREAVAIPEKNPFVFARPNRQSLQCMRAWDCLRNISMQCQPPLLNPANITSTKLRKYIATISQVLSMEEKEVDWPARHLGHDIRVHRDFYRLHESTIEIAKVSKLLLTVDQGETRKFAGKTLQEINLNDIAEPDLSDDTDYEDEDDVESSTETAEGTTSARSKETKSGKMCAKDPAERSVNSSMGKPAQGSNDPEKENTTSVNSAAKLPEKTRNQSRNCQKKSTKEGVHCSVKQSKNLSDDTDCEYEDWDKSSNEITDSEGTTSAFTESEGIMFGDPKSDEENVIEDENDDIQCSKSYKQNMKRRKRLFSGSSSDEDNMSHSAEQHENILTQKV